MDPGLYHSRARSYSTKAVALKNRLRRLSLLRLLAFLTFLVLVFGFTQNQEPWTLLVAGASLAAFFYLIRFYDHLRQQQKFNQLLAATNDTEYRFLIYHEWQYPEGLNYEDPQHPYSWDLDLFGPGGLYSYLNRCSTRFGEQALAADLLDPDTSAIGDRQEAIQELAAKIDFRQDLYVYGQLHDQEATDLDRLLHWLDTDKKLISGWQYRLLLLFPAATLLTLTGYFLTAQDRLLHLFYLLFVLNLVVAFSFGRKITAELSFSSSVNKILNNYHYQLNRIEKEDFQSRLLQAYQQQLGSGAQSAAALIRQLASLFNYMETIVNLVVSVFLNGLFLFHVHILYRLGKWKQTHASEVRPWLELAGKMEALASFGNLSYNNPEFCRPQILSERGMVATSMGHLLVNPSKRVCNDFSLKDQQFIILTGSNMSGKSTFLRTLGTNLILARAGSVVCATAFACFPFDVWVSMRITDSLQDSESFFYAELKRLHAIIGALEQQGNLYVILDEILRGTNSDDKRNGTIGLIKKLAALDSYGIIATHDLVVAELSQSYPGVIANKAFESRIINDELQFDYKLHDGVCTTLSATHLMKKMGII
ncbi:MutS family DNA mismatch repair protein [Niabella terrae]